MRQGFWGDDTEAKRVDQVKMPGHSVLVEQNSELMAPRHLKWYAPETGQYSGLW